MRDEQRLLVGLVPHHKVQRGGALVKRRHVGQQEHRSQGENLPVSCHTAPYNSNNNSSVCSQMLVEIIDVKSSVALWSPKIGENQAG